MAVDSFQGASTPTSHQPTCENYCRDSDGNLFLKDPPYVTDPYSLERLAYGLPFPVKCCWNGLVVMDAAPFTRHNLRIRCLFLILACLVIGTVCAKSEQAKYTSGQDLLLQRSLP